MLSRNCWLLFIHEGSFFCAIKRHVSWNELMLRDIDDEIIDIEDFVLAENIWTIRCARLAWWHTSLAWELQIHPLLLLLLDLILEDFVRYEHHLFGDNLEQRTTYFRIVFLNLKERHINPPRKQIQNRNSMNVRIFHFSV